MSYSEICTDKGMPSWEVKKMSPEEWQALVTRANERVRISMALQGEGNSAVVKMKKIDPTKKQVEGT